MSALGGVAQPRVFRLAKTPFFCGDRASTEPPYDPGRSLSHISCHPASPLQSVAGATPAITVTRLSSSGLPCPTL